MKKTVCFLLSVMLMLPALPAAMATGGQEETVTTVTPADAAYIRNGAHADTALGGKTLVVDGGAGENRRVTYLKFDLSSYMEEIEKCDEIEFSLMPNLSPSPANANFLVYLLPDHLEGWSSEELTFRKATEMDMVDDGGELIYASPDTLTHGQVHRTGNIRDAVVRHLGENPGNSVISLKVDSTLGAGYVIYSDSGRGPKLTITRTINYSDIVQNAWDSLTFDKLSGETEESVCMDLTLPEMLGDSVTVEWESSDPSVIDVSTGFVYRPRRNETAAEVRLTAKLSAGGYERTKEFILTVPAGERVPEDMIAGTESSYATDGRAVRRGIEHADTVQGNTYMQIDSRPSDGLQREVFLKFDLSGCAELWKTVDSLTFTLRTYSDSNVKDQNNFVVYLLPEEMEQYVDENLTYNIADRAGMIDYREGKIYASPTGVEARTAYTTGDFSEKVKQHFEENPDNKVIALKVASTSGVGYSVYGPGSGAPNAPSLNLTYSLPDYQKDALSLSLPKIVSGNIELPKTGEYGSPIEWISSDEELISSGGVVSIARADENYSTEDGTATLTAVISGEGAQEVRDFTVRVRREGIIDAYEDTFVTTDANYADSDEIIFGSAHGNIALVGFDLAESYPATAESRSVVLKLYGAPELAGKTVTLRGVTDSALLGKEITALTWEDCAELTDESFGYEISAVCDNERYITLDVTEYIWSRKDGRALFLLTSGDEKVELISRNTLNCEPKLVISPIAYSDSYGVKIAADALTFPVLSEEEPDSIRQKLTLPKTGRYGSTITWTCSDPTVVDTETGMITRGESDRTVTLTAVVETGDVTVAKDFIITVVHGETDAEYAEYLLGTLALPGAVLTSDIRLPGNELPEGAKVTWSSSESYEAEPEGFLLKVRRPAGNDLAVVLTAHLEYREISLSKEFAVKVLRSADRNLLLYKNIISGDQEAFAALDDEIESYWVVNQRRLEVDMGSVRLLGGFTLIPYQGSFGGLKIFMSSDRLVWEQVYDGGSFAAGNVNYLVPDKTAYGRYVRFDFPPEAYGISYLAAYNTVNGAADDVLANVSVPERSTTDFALATVAGGGEIRWTSSSAAIEISGGTARVTRQSEDVYVVLTASVAVDGTEYQKSFLVFVPKREDKPSSGGRGGGGGGGASLGAPSGFITGASDAVASPKLPDANAGFTDLGSAAWAAGYINALAARGIVDGRGDGSFDPLIGCKREEMAKILVKAFRLEGRESGTFSDVDENEWYYPYIRALCGSGAAQGIGGGRFGVGMNITRQDAFCMVAAVLGETKAEDSGKAAVFADEGQIAGYAAESVRKLAALGVVGGDDAGRINPGAEITRAEMAKIIYLALSCMGDD